MLGMLKRNENANFDLLAYFEGKTDASGVFEDRSGRTKRRFSVGLNGHASGNSLVLDEVFLFDDGERQTRTWTLTRNGSDAFTGNCADAVSTAHGKVAPGRATLRSALKIDVGARKIVMNFDDVFYSVGNGCVMNRSVVSKWGIRLGQVLILFRKPDYRTP
jgi:hypothetical protein